MDKSLQTLCSAIKKLAFQLRQQNNHLSFLILTGKANNGKTILLQQSQFKNFAVDTVGAEIYYNQNGIVLDLGETWLNQSSHLLQYTLKQLNRCHPNLNVSGFIFCIDINELLNVEPIDFKEKGKTIAQLAKRFCQSLSYKVDISIIFTKMDSLAGFCDFFYNEHAVDLQKPLGFSIEWQVNENKNLNNYNFKFDQFIEMLGQKVIHKMHPARSSIKRILIREFPLQIASLGSSIKILVNSISSNKARVQNIYFTSSEQGGISVDRLNKKIQHEYALTVQDKFPQSFNHRAYFIEGALLAIQDQTKRCIKHNVTAINKCLIISISSITTITFLWLSLGYFQSLRYLDEVSKELLTYDNLQNKQTDHTGALYHLSKAANTIEQLSPNDIFSPNLQTLKTQLRFKAKQYLQGNFLPIILSEIEQDIVDTRQPQAARYQALKIYLMLGEPNKFKHQEVVTWFKKNWENESSTNLKKKLALLDQSLKQPFQALPINSQIVSDVRNYLNALPPSYLYYSLAKSYFPNDKRTINIDGFNLHETEVPIYFTKEGYEQIINSLPLIGEQLQGENWVLARQDLKNLPAILKQAYNYEYVNWWQNFMHKTEPLHFQDYKQAKQITQAMHQGDSINNLIEFIRHETTPENGDNASSFNQDIASKFTELSLMSHTAIRDLIMNINELEKFVSTLSAVNDQGKSAFMVTKSRFSNDSLANPLSSMYNQVKQLPEPLAQWTKNIADDTWFILINDTKAYINKQWRELVIREYNYSIAKRYPFDANQAQEVLVSDFDHFFSKTGILNNFVKEYLLAFIDTSTPQWHLKELNNYVLPISSNMIDALIQANVISNMFFSNTSNTSKIEFSLQKITLDPIVAKLKLIIGNTKLEDDQSTEDSINFLWPQANARLELQSIDGNKYELEELGPWAFFKILQKVNVLVDEQDSSNLEILFEINGNTGRYALKTKNQINPFIPGILNGFMLNDSIA